MKKLLFICAAFLCSFNVATAEEKNKCDEFKKFSKEHLLCKTNEIKENVKKFSITDSIKIDGKSVNEIIKKK